MEALTSPKIIVGVHCLKIRTKSMYIQAVVDPAEATFYDKFDQTAYWCVHDADRPRPGPPARPPRRLLRRPRLLQSVEQAPEGCRASHEEDRPFVRTVEPDAGDALREAGVDYRHLRRGENGRGVRRRLRHERRSRDDRTRGAAGLEGRSRPGERRLPRRPRRRRRARGRHQPRHSRDRRRIHAGPRRAVSRRARDAGAAQGARRDGEVARRTT